MGRGIRFDAVLIAAAVLCIGPGVVTIFHLGLPNGLRWWDSLTMLTFTTLLLGLPQLVMLAYVRVVRWTPMRLTFVAGSAAMLGYYYIAL